MWNSIEEIVDELGLQSELDDLAALCDELKRLLASAHPDLTRGEFADKRAETRFHRINSALEFVKSQRNTSLVVLAQLPSELRAITEAIKSQEIERLQDSFLSQFYRKNRRRRFSRRVTSALLATIFGMISVSPESIITHPLAAVVLQIFGITIPYFASTSYERLMNHAGIVSGLAFMAFGAYLLFALLREQQESVAAEYLMSDQGLRDTFSYLCAQPFLQGSSSLGLTFSVRHVIEAMQKKGSPTQGLLVVPKTVEDVTNVLLAKLTQRGLIRRLNRFDIDEWYEVDPKDVNRYREPPHTIAKPALPAWRRIRRFFGSLLHPGPPNTGPQADG